MCSTTGNGDPPDNAERFARWIKRKTLSPCMLAGIRYAVLALGDTNYDKWCIAGKQLYHRFEQLGASPFYVLGCADESVGLEAVVDPWMAGLWPALESLAAGQDVVPAGAELTPAGLLAPAGAPAGAVVHAARPPATAALAPSSPTTARPAFTTSPAVDDTTATDQPSPLPPSCGAGLLHRMRHMSTRARASSSEAGARFAARIPQPWKHLVQPSKCPYDMDLTLRDVLEDAATPGMLPPSAWLPADIPDELPSTARLPRSGTASATCALSSNVQPDFNLAAAYARPALDPQARLMPVLSAQYMTKPRSTMASVPFRRRVIDVKLDARALGMEAPAWQPGDAIGIRVPNPPVLVLAICARLGVQPQQVLSCVSVEPKAASSAGTSVSKVCETPSADGPPPDAGAGVAPATKPRMKLKLKKSSKVTSSAPGASLSAGKPGAAGSRAALAGILQGLGEAPTVARVLAWKVDLLSPPSRAMLAHAARAWCGGDAKTQRALLWLASTAGTDTYRQYIQAAGMTVLELLQAFPALCPKLPELLALLPAMPRRFYSLASSPLATPHVARFCFSVVAWHADALKDPLHERGPQRWGLATHQLEHWLHTLLQGCDIPGVTPAVQIDAVLRPPTGFVPPAGLDKPIVMIGPGTGVAPFMGFIAHRQAQHKAATAAQSAALRGEWRGGMMIDPARDPDAAAVPALGPSHLFFGNRDPAVDWLYKAEMEHAVTADALTQLHLAWSRQPGSAKCYVQDRLLEPSTAATIARLIMHRDAHVYVCGDGARMARDVDAALQQLLGTWAGIAEPATLLKDMAQAGRYVRDIWS